MQQSKLTKMLLVVFVFTFSFVFVSFDAFVCGGVASLTSPILVYALLKLRNS